MIHTLLNITRPLFVIDVESTGLDVAKDRIVELGFEMWTAEGLAKEWRSLVNPGVPIPASATRVHGITDAHVQGCRHCERSREAHLQPPIGTIGDPTRHCEGFGSWPSFKQLAANLAKGFADCDFCGKNVRYDLRILSAEMQRAGQPWSYLGARIVDIDRLEALANPRDLGTLHEKYTGRRHDGAHGALSDVRASTTVLMKQLEAYPNLPRDLDKLHEASWPGWLCDGGQFKMVDGVAVCQFGKWRGKAMKDIDSSYWDWILSSDFSEDVKALARDAKLGKFPDA